MCISTITVNTGVGMVRITDKNPIYPHEHQVLHVLHEYNRWKIDVECGWLNEQVYQHHDEKFSYKPSII